MRTHFAKKRWVFYSNLDGESICQRSFTAQDISPSHHDPSLRQANAKETETFLHRHVYDKKGDKNIRKRRITHNWTWRNLITVSKVRPKPTHSHMLYLCFPATYYPESLPSSCLAVLSDSTNQKHPERVGKVSGILTKRSGMIRPLPCVLAHPQSALRILV